MAVSANELAEIDAALSAPDADAQLLSALRQRFAHLSWTRCDASDVTEVPFRSYARVDLHLLDSGDHCAHITAEPERATGIILATRNVAS